MRSYWIKIAIGALLVFGLGYAAYAAGSRFVNQVKSSESITIPLGAFGAYLPFKLEGTQLGTLRSFTFRRREGVVTGFALRARVEDTAAFERMRKCTLSISDMETVRDLENIDERTTFVCLLSDSGHAALGEARVELRTGDDRRTLIQPILFPNAFVEEFHRRMAQHKMGRSYGDSIASEIRTRIRASTRAPTRPSPP